jgi:hypothetical protein
MSVGEYGIYIENGNSLSLDGVGTGTLQASNQQVMGMTVNMLTYIIRS